MKYIALVYVIVDFIYLGFVEPREAPSKRELQHDWLYRRHFRSTCFHNKLSHLDLKVIQSV